MKMKLQRLSMLAMAATLFSSGAVMAEDDWGWSRRGPGVAPVKNELYKSECGACHFAYQPGLLTAASWQKLMGGLDSHFGENAELDAPTQKELTTYLVMNAADNVEGYRRSAKIARSVADTVPLRITEVPYIRYKHNEIPMRVIKVNKDIGSLSNCAACHTRADTGSFSEREIRIPGIGRWED
jgi:hypothetical protein